jgi:hypothetical protein
LTEARTCQQVITEAERNLSTKLPQALSAFRPLVNRCLQGVSDPTPAQLGSHTDIANPKDLPILVCVVREACPYLVTFSVRDYEPGHAEVTVLKPGEFVLRVRDLLAHLDANVDESD